MSSESDGNMCVSAFTCASPGAALRTRSFSESQSHIEPPAMQVGYLSIVIMPLAT